MGQAAISDLIATHRKSHNRRQLSIPPPTPFGGAGSMLGEVPRYNCKGRVVVSQNGNLVRQLIYHERRNRGRALL
jgi:hypothetical protein